ncbi:MAG: hydrogenase/urease accessory protein HupE [Halieaceae bacterium]|jgi:hydrogenase/urease accessory protein HupE
MRIPGLLLFLVTVMVAESSFAHRFAPSLLRINETAENSYRVLWKTSQKSASNVPLRPILPESCEAETQAPPQFEGTGVLVVWNIQCEGGLIGKELGVSGLADNRASVMVMLELADGRVLQTSLNEGAPKFVVPDKASRFGVFKQYLVIGVEHILSGLDHLLFVLGLLLLVGMGSRLLWTVSAFTIGHSFTLSLAALGYISFPVGLIEFAIAVSIFVVALELVPGPKRQEDLIHRHPWWLASGFGLLHGMGFAGALTEIGLPSGEVPMALFSFNVGIEIGQIVFLMAAIVVWRLSEKLLSGVSQRLQWAPAYVLGSLSVMWCIQRLLDAL